MSTFVIYHAHCADGLTAASIYKFVHSRKNITYIEGSYNKTLEEYPDFTDAEVIFLDFSFKEKEFRSLLQVAKSITVVDHHITAYEYLHKIKEEDNVFNTYIFDNDECGSSLTFKWLMPKTPLPLAIEYIKDQDIYRWLYKEDSVPFCLFIETLNTDLETFLSHWIEILMCSNHITKPTKYIDIGKTLLKLRNNYVNIIKEKYQVIKYLDLDIIVVNCPSIFTNQVSDQFRDNSEYHYVITYSICKKGYSFSLRSSKGYSTLPITLSISEKGGGHVNASGAFLSHQDFEKHPLKKLLIGL